VRPHVGRVEDKRATQTEARTLVRIVRPGLRSEALVVDPAVHCLYALRGDTKDLDDAPGRVFAGGDHRSRAAGGSVVREAPQRPLGRREETRKIVVLDVVEGDHLG
jgi:hypothetical protein